MAAEPSGERAPAEVELAVLRARIDALEDELVEQVARAHRALAAAQDRAYWLERWGLDLDAAMRRPRVRQTVAVLRATRNASRAARRRLRRLRALVGRVHAARRLLVREGAAARAAEREGEAPGLARLGGPDPLAGTPVTDLLTARMTDDDLAEIESRLDAADAVLWAAADDTERNRLALAFASRYGVAGALERTGLSEAMPPPEVHAMARTSTAAGGSTYYADLVVVALASAGLELRPGLTVLDFGCSSGRVVRVLAAAFSEVDWHGCDPNADAIAWAAAHLPGIAFARSAEAPPLTYGDAAFDAVFAVSIWSHLAEGAALAWLDEMRRVLRPGGLLLLTTHGLDSVAHANAHSLRPPEQLDEIVRRLYETGFWYAAEFGERGDHGIRSPDWGTAFLTPGWLLARTTPEWRCALLRRGAVESNQDLYVLQRA
jgi:SAM-dependent methyltransferase